MAGVKKGDKPGDKTKNVNAPDEAPVKDIEGLKREREEIQTLLSSLEDAYYEATILEEDYNDIKAKNKKRLEDIENQIKSLEKEQTEKISREREKVMEEMKEEPEKKIAPPPVAKEPAAAPRISEKTPAPAKPEIDVEQLEEEMSNRFKEIVSGLSAKIGDSDVAEITKKLEKYNIDIERMKAVVESLKEMRSVDGEKVQRANENIAELRSIVFQREVMMKDYETKIQKMADIVSQIDPEKIIMEMGKKDREISSQAIKIDKLEGKFQTIDEIMKRLRNVITNIGSLENMINMSKESTEKLMEMKNVQANIQKLSDKIHGLYAEMSNRLEEFDIYKRKQDRYEALVDSLMNSVDDLNKKLGSFATKEDLESIKAIGPVATGGAAPSESDDLENEKEEIESLLKSLEEGYAAAVIPKNEYEKTRRINLAKLAQIEKKLKSSPESAPAAPAAPSEGKSEMKGLDDAYRKGLITKKAYEKAKKLMSKK
ncbi:MAG: hypothetical protein JW754_02450 [Candidatus Aenigmarchaeota archaeon]|nr:hypothetical protein [Candidatus Aenigmarchaeota archaeon]